MAQKWHIFYATLTAHHHILERICRRQSHRGISLEPPKPALGVEAISPGAIEAVTHLRHHRQMNSALITRQQAATLLDVSLRTISNHIRAGVLPPPQSLGGRRVYWKSDIFWAAVNGRLEPALVRQEPRSLARVADNTRRPGRPRKSAKL